MKFFKPTLFMALFFCIKAHAIYRSPHYTDHIYREKAIPFGAVMKISVKGTKPSEESFGTGTYIQDVKTGKYFILTAAHVIKEGHRAHIHTPQGPIPLERIHYFAKDLQTRYKEKKIALSFIDQVHHKRLYGGRMEDEAIVEAINHYGGDIAVAFLPEGTRLALSPLKIAYNTHQNGSFLVIGFGASGVIGHIGRWTGTVDGAGQKRAYRPNLQRGIKIKMLDFETSLETEHVSWMEIIHENNGSSLPGQVGYGDSGGPVLRQNGKTYEVVGIVSSVRPAYKTDNFLKTATLWQKFMIAIGQKCQSNSYESYLFGCEANTYGSEALFSGVISSWVYDWIQDCLN